jgi:hypothetical protein
MCVCVFIIDRMGRGEEEAHLGSAYSLDRAHHDETRMWTCSATTSSREILIFSSFYFPLRVCVCVCIIINVVVVCEQKIGGGRFRASADPSVLQQTATVRDVVHHLRDNGESTKLSAISTDPRRRRGRTKPPPGALMPRRRSPARRGTPDNA